MGLDHVSMWPDGFLLVDALFRVAATLHLQDLCCCKPQNFSCLVSGVMLDGDVAHIGPVVCLQPSLTWFWPDTAAVAPYGTKPVEGVFTTSL